MTEKLEELQLPREVESESRGAIYSIPIMEDGGGGSSSPEDPSEAPRILLGNFTLDSNHLREVGGRRASPGGCWGHSCHNSGPTFLSSSTTQGIVPFPLTNVVFK